MASFSCSPNPTPTPTPTPVPALALELAPKFMQISNKPVNSLQFQLRSLSDAPAACDLWSVEYCATKCGNLPLKSNSSRQSLLAILAAYDFNFCTCAKLSRTRIKLFANLIYFFPVLCFYFVSLLLFCFLCALSWLSLHLLFGCLLRLLLTGVNIALGLEKLRARRLFLLESVASAISPTSLIAQFV